MMKAVSVLVGDVVKGVVYFEQEVYFFSFSSIHTRYILY